MKGFKHVFAAGALGLVLAVTGCTQYGTSVTEPPITTGNTGTTRSYTVPNRYAVNTARNLNRARNAQRTYMAKRANRTAARGVRTAPSGNEYTYTTPAPGSVKRNTQAVKRSRVNTSNYRGTTGRAVERGRNLAGGIYNTGNVTQLPASRRGNNTGSPFGDFNKDRAYSLTRNTAGVNTRNTAGANNINAASDSVSRNAASSGASTGSVIRKSFSEGTEYTRSAEGGQSITTKTPARTRNTGAANVAKNTGTTKKSNVKRTNNTAAARSAAGVQTAQKAAANTINTTAKSNTAPNNINTTANNVSSTANNVNTTANNASRNTGAAVTNAKRAQGTGAVLSSLPASRRSLGSGFEGVAYNERRNSEINKNRGTQRTHMKSSSAPSGRVTRTVYEINDGTGRPTRQAVTYDYEPEGSNSSTTNYAPARGTGSRSRTTRSTGTGRTSYVNDGFQRYGYFDNLTYGNTYRNADLRNNYNYTGTRYGYSPSGSYSETTRGMNTGASGTYGRYGMYRGGYGYYPGAAGAGYYGTAAGVYR